MKFTLKAGIALAALTGAVAMTGSAIAADLGAPRGGSIKDGYVEAMPQIVRGPSGPCYFRADVGYSASTDPTINWAQTDPITLDYITSDVRTLSYDNSWFGEVGAGCGSGSRGIRGELMLGLHGGRKIDGEPATAWYGYDHDNNPVTPVQPEDDPLHTTVKSYTAMVNLYKDLGNYGGITPYVGAGIGAAYNMVDDVYFTGNPSLVNRIKGDNDLSFAWALMAGVGYQVSDRAILDFGYRYLDLGSAGSQNGDSAGNWNPRVSIDDLTSHEFKVGLRYHFGSADCCAQQYAPMK
ncbi:MAG: porin family protein [Hyphomicrobium sp.]|nr:porin family protein [Hyphomicrobium sp.]